MGPGPYWAPSRPYHLTSLETPFDRPAVPNRPSSPPPLPHGQSVAVANDLNREKIDGLGGFTVYG